VASYDGRQRRRGQIPSRRQERIVNRQRCRSTTYSTVALYASGAKIGDLPSNSFSANSNHLIGPTPSFQGLKLRQLYYIPKNESNHQNSIRQMPGAGLEPA
jgi:hypothetical protein